MWKLLTITALNSVRAKSAYHYATKRRADRIIGGTETLDRLDVEDDCDGSAPGSSGMIISEFMDRLPSRDRRLVELRIEGFGVAHTATAHAHR